MDLLGNDEAIAAQELLKASKAGLESLVKQSIADYRRAFNCKSENEKKQLQTRALFESSTERTQMSRFVDCPACSTEGLVKGRSIRRSKPYLEDDTLVEEVTNLAESFSCFACGLILPNASHLQWSGLEPQFTVVIETSLQEHHQYEYYDEYGND